MDIKISHFKEGMKDELANMWHMCFGDSIEYAELFIKYCSVPEDTIVALADGVLVGVVYIVRAKQRAARDAMYGYAGSVLPAYRNYGIFTKVINACKDKAQKENCDFFLCPVPHLVEYYKQLAISTQYYYTEYSIDKENIPMQQYFNMTHNKLCARELKLMRDDCFIESGSIIWDEAFLNYAIRESEFRGGIADEITFNKRRGYIYGQISDNRFTIVETCFSKTDIDLLAPSLFRVYEVNHLTVSLPSYKGSGRQLYALTTNSQIANSAWVGIALR